MGSAGAVLFALTVGGFFVALELQRRRGREQARQRARVSAPAPYVPPTKGPETDVVPEPVPPPDLDPVPEDDRVSISEDRWQEICWWTMKSKADAYMEIGTTYRSRWPLEWKGDEEHLIYVDPADLADVELEGFWEDGEMYLELTLTPKRLGWGTLMATEGTPGAGAVSGETPWRSQCMKIEVI